MGGESEGIVLVNEDKNNNLINENEKKNDSEIEINKSIIKPTFRQRLHDFKNSLLKPSQSLEESVQFLQLQKFQKKIPKVSENFSSKIKGKVTLNAKCQILRSASNWSIGLKASNHENSILNAYMAMILAAEHFIYIENQFFISTVQSSRDNPVINEIAKAIYLRICRAAKEKKKFKVIVVMPLLPGFEGDIYQKNSGLLKIQLHYEYQTISRGGRSLIEMLKKDPNIKNPSDYISFYGLRTHHVMNDKPVTEIIYVHSKLIIVDDKYTLIGSANINDRSMLGNRDSELAILIEDQKFLNSKMNGIGYMAGEFSHSLRTNIFQEHFGLEYEQVSDPLSDNFLDKIYENTERNTLMYRNIFNCYPDDLIRKIDKNATMQVKEPSLETYQLLKNKIIGHAVEFPLYFMCEESLKFKLMSKERILPDHNFT